MARNRLQSPTTVFEKGRKLDSDIAARRAALAKSVGTSFVAKIGNNLAPKDAAPLDDLVVLHGPEKPIFLPSR